MNEQAIVEYWQWSSGGFLATFMKR